MSATAHWSKNITSFVVVTAVVVALGLIVRWQYLDYYAHLGLMPSTNKIKTSTNFPPVIPETTTLPASHLLKVPFTVQAPLAVWDSLHEEACEEASLLMVQHFQANKQFGSPAENDTEIKELVSWETDHGYKVDLTLAQLSSLAKERFGLKGGRVVINPTSEDIKREIAAGRPVIVPAAGRILPNPYFTPPGPNYHMLVIKGYDSKGFITNDPGTKHGEGFRYTFGGLLNAVHDWNSTDILLGQKAVLVFD